MHYIALYPQNGDLIVTIESVTSLHPRYKLVKMQNTRRNEKPVAREQFFRWVGGLDPAS